MESKHFTSYQTESELKAKYSSLFHEFGKDADKMAAINVEYKKAIEALKKPSQVNPLLEFKVQAVRANNWTSFYPEKRGQQVIDDYGEELASDIAELSNSEHVSGAAIADYEARYKRLFSSWLSAKSNCFSVMITGPSGFNNRKHAKANRSEERHYEIFREWRERAKKAIIRKAQPAKTNESELERYKAELATLQKNQEMMKSSNAIIRNAKGNDCTDKLIKLGMKEKTAKTIQQLNWLGSYGFPAYELTNNNTNIKRIQQRIKELELKEVARVEMGEIKYSFDGGTMVINYEADRIQIMFNSRPTTEELSQWKAKGLSSFNWSPSNSCWQRKITGNAYYATKQMFKDMNLKEIN
jgi:hypothetical protein